MKNLALLFVSAFGLFSFFASADFFENPNETLEGLNHRDEIHHDDPYRWLEVDDVHRMQWVLGQGERTRSHILTLPQAESWRSHLQGEMSRVQIVAEKKFEPTTLVQLRNRGLQEPSEVVLVDALTNSVLRVLLSEEDVNKNSNRVQRFMRFDIGPHGKYLTVSAVENGSIDRATLYVVDVNTGLVEVTIEEVSTMGVLAWLGTDRFMYYKFIGNEGLRLVYQIGHGMEIVPESFAWSRVFASPKKNYLLKQSENGLTQIRSINGGDWIELDEMYYQALAETNSALFLVNYQSDQTTFKLTRLPVYKDANGEIQIGEAKEIRFDPIGNLRPYSFESDGYLVLHYIWGKESHYQVLDPDGNEFAVIDSLPGLGLRGIKKEGEFLDFQLTSPIHPRKSVRFSLRDKKFLDEHVVKTLMTDELGVEYQTTYLTAESLDGTSVPIRVVHRKGLQKNGQNPALVEAYGGFGLTGSFYRGFSFPIKTFLQDGGIYVTPALRGGGFFGKEWQDQGRLLNKQNVFNDFIATLEKIHFEKYTSPQKTAMMGWSNGGLLMGSVLTQRPDLMALAIPGNGVLDMLRKDMLDYGFNRGWSFEYGSTRQPAHFLNLQSYSPVHRSEAHNSYPTTLVVSGRQDSRVNPVHSYKFVASLQYAQKSNDPIFLLDINNAGHWPTMENLVGERALETLTSIWSMIYSELNMQLGHPLDLKSVARSDFSEPVYSDEMHHWQGQVPGTF